MQPILLSPINTEELDEKTWLQWREHGPDNNIKWTIGGSDVATILNLSPWTSPIELYERKKGIKPAIEVNYNSGSKEMGHLNEAHVARLFEKDLKAIYPEKNIQLFFDKHMYQCGDRNEDGSLKYPWMIVNFDAYVLIDGKLYLVEIKTTSPNNISTIEKWKEGKCPEYYECQCRYCMKALDVEGIFIVCAWDYRGLGEGRNFVYIQRDKAAEDYIIAECQAFVDGLENNIPPEITDCNNSLLRNYYERLYGPNESTEEFEIPQEYEDVIKQYISIEESIEKLKEKMKYYEKLEDECFVKLLPLFEKRQKGRFILDDEHDVYITSKHSYKREIPCKEEYFKATYPDIYEKYAKRMVDMTKLKKEQPNVFRDVSLPKIPTDNRSWKLKVHEKKAVVK